MITKAERSIFIECREWFDKTYGNSYYSARVFVDGQHVHTTGMSYGYEFAYEDEVTRALVRQCVVPADALGYGVRRWARENGIDFYSVKYSSFKRELWPEWTHEELQPAA